MTHRIVAIMRKEFLHAIRDPRTLSILFFIPAIQLFLLGYAASTDVEHLKTGVLDLDHSARSRSLIDSYQASNCFDVIYFVDDRETIERLIDQGKARIGIIILGGFGREIDRKGHPQVELIIDGSDPSVANNAFASAQSVGQAFSSKLVRESVGMTLEDQPGLDMRLRVWYNPEMRSVNFMVPGVVGLVLQMLSMMMTALAIVREREQGTIEQLIVTPIRPFELILGKVVPYAILVFINVAGVLSLAVLWFKVPIHGSVPLLLMLNAFAMTTTLSLGLFVSTIARSQQEAMLLTYFLILPSVFLSGFVFPIEAMPALLQLLSNLVPLRYLLVIIRGIILKGIGIDLLQQEVIILGLFSIVVLILTATRFHKRLE